MNPLTILLHLVIVCTFAEAFYLSEQYGLQVDSTDGKLTAVQLATKYGYRIEQHEVQTEDGYLLDVQRITGSGSTMYDRKLPPVLLMHGFITSSADWLLMGPGNALAYELSDMGYDVWLGNARGNRYSRKHITYSADMARFWDFSWHEIGVYDLPAMIDYTLNATGKEKLHYIGFSQGTTTLFVMCSERPEYNEKLILAQAMAPVVYLEHMQSPLLKFLVDSMEVISTVLDLFGVAELKPANQMLVQLAKYICPTSQTNTLCTNVLFLLTGADPEQIDPKIVPVLMGHIPAGSSTRQLIHFGQSVQTAQFRQYDYGKVKNIFVYGEPEPPAYRLENVTVPVVLHYGANDYLSNVDDVHRLAQQLPNLVESRLIDTKLFNHVDFLVAKDVKKLLYDAIVSYVENYGYD